MHPHEYGTVNRLLRKRIFQPMGANLSNSDVSSILLIVLLLIGLAQVFGYIFVKLRQPKVIGEIWPASCSARYSSEDCLSRRAWLETADTDPS